MSTSWTKHVGSLIRHSSARSLPSLITTAHQLDDTDPPPYKPAPSDHISLNQKDSHGDSDPKFRSVRPRFRIEAHSDTSIPKQIRLKAVRINSETAESQSTVGSTNKSSGAGTALTQTFIHNYLPDEQDGERKSPSTADSRQRSATLQVVRSRDSVYEVIWEDTRAVEHSTSSSSSSSPISPNGLAVVFSHRNPASTNAALAAWSWDGELKPYATAKQALDSTPAPLQSRRSSSKNKDEAEDQDSRGGWSADPSIPATIENELDPSLGGQHPQDARRSIEEWPLTTNRLATILNGERSASLRDGRKLSNLTLEDDHFALHRDSLILAHERIHHKKVKHGALGRTKCDSQPGKGRRSGEERSTPLHQSDGYIPGKIAPSHGAQSRLSVLVRTAE